MAFLSAMLNAKRKMIMIRNSKHLLYGLLLFCLPSIISASITKIQHWDPSPVYNAMNSSVPPSSHLSNIIKKDLKTDNSPHKPKCVFNLSPFTSRAVKGISNSGEYFGDYYYDTSTITKKAPGTELSDYQGTPYLMGLFLGNDEDGNNIWVDNTETTNIANITDASIATTSLPTNLQNAIKYLNDTTNSTASVLFNTTTAGSTSPTIFSESVLERDRKYFGAISIPLTYQKIGFRWEVNFDITDDIGLIMRGGVCQVKHVASSYTSLTNATDYADASLDTIYPSLTRPATTTAPSTEAQALFNTWITGNVDKLLDATDGANYDITTFSETGFEDCEANLFLRHSFQMHPPHEEENLYDSVILTPYLVVGGTLPLAKQKDYTKLFALPLGNNGHASVGGSAGITFDFAHSVEVGAEAGYTHFFEQDILQMPCPNHKLQRVFYPYRRDMRVDPGQNWHFSGLFNAYEFMPGISFYLTYKYMQHAKDTITQKTANANFFPSMLEDLSAWNSQMFTAAFSFAVQPNIHASLAWQGALNQQNAYFTNTIVGSLSVLF